jgi:integrase
MMDWGSVDLVRRVIITIPRKTARTGREVEIPIHPVLFAILTETPSYRRKGRVLPETASTYARDGSAVSKQIQAIFERAGIETVKTAAGYSRNVAVVGFHSLRHSFVSMMGNAGAPLALVQSIVGHQNPMMTAHYFHAKTDALSNAVNALPALMGETVDFPSEPPPQMDSPRLAAFRSLWAEMDAEERTKAKKWIETEK